MECFAIYTVSDDLFNLLQDAEDHALENEGEIPEWLADRIDELELERDDLIAQVARQIVNYNGLSEMLRNEELKLQKRRHIMESAVERLKATLCTAMKPGEKFQDANISIGWRKSESCKITDEELIPEAFIKTVKSVSVTDVKKAIKLGIPVPGAEIVEKMNIQVK